MALIVFNNVSFDDERIAQKNLLDFIDFQMPRVMQDLPTKQRKEALTQLHMIACAKVKSSTKKEDGEEAGKSNIGERKNKKRCLI